MRNIRAGRWVLLAVLGKRTCRADHDLRIGAGSVTLQECNFRLANCQSVVERAEWDLEGMRRVSVGSHMRSITHRHN